MSHPETPDCRSCQQSMVQDADLSLENDEPTFQCENVDCCNYLVPRMRWQIDNDDEADGLARDQRYLR